MIAMMAMGAMMAMMAMIVPGHLAFHLIAMLFQVAFRGRVPFMVRLQVEFPVDKSAPETWKRSESLLLFLF